MAESPELVQPMLGIVNASTDTVQGQIKGRGQVKAATT